MTESWVFVEGNKKFFPTPMRSSPLAILRANVSECEQKEAVLWDHFFLCCYRYDSTWDNLRHKIRKWQRIALEHIFTDFFGQTRLFQKTSNYLKKKVQQVLILFFCV